MKKNTRKWILCIIAIVIIALVLLIIFWPSKDDSETSEGYSCPTDTDWVNCMPTFTGDSGQSDSTINSADYCKFVEDNCPDISVVY